jgi:AcrR family transcriptional regulator
MPGAKRDKGSTKGQRNRRGKQKALVRAAAKLFSSRGYDATTTREIAQTAGCAEGLIHKYFGGKAGLLSTILREHLSQYGDRAAEPNNLEDSLERSIQRFVEKQLDHLWKERDLLRVSFSRAIVEPKVGKRIGKSAPPRHAKSLLRILEHNQKSRFLSRKDLDAAAHAIVALTFSMGFLRPTVLGMNRATCREIAHGAAIMVLRGLMLG